MVFQKRSIFPSVMGWCGALRMCCTRSFARVIWKRVLPCQATYCRPLSVSIYLGAPYCATARR